MPELRAESHGIGSHDKFAFCIHRGGKLGVGSLGEAWGKPGVTSFFFLKVFPTNE